MFAAQETGLQCEVAVELFEPSDESSHSQMFIDRQVYTSHHRVGSCIEFENAVVA